MAKPKYPQSEALEMARLNAIRMLGLHEHNTPEDRARAMGFEPGWGHGSPHNDIVELKPSRTGAQGPGAYATQHLPETAMYAMGKEGATSYPLMVKRAQALDIGMKNPYEHFGVEDDQALKRALHDADKTGMVVKQPSTADWLKDLDVADYPERNHYVSMHPHTFRSRFAAFDPARAHEAGLSYKEGGDVEPTPDQMRQILSTREHDENLAKFLKNSKIKDKVYHGTNQDFQEFDPTKIGSATDEGWLGHGHYFTTDPSVADSYGKTIMPMYISAKNPYDMNGKNFSKVLKEHGGPKKFSEWLRKQGHDSATMWSQYMVLDPHQIKSAIGNRGTYDLNNRNINMAEGGTVGHYAENGEVKAEPSQDEMLAHVMLRNMTSLKNVGANEAPNLKVKAYVAPGVGPGLPVGGVDFQPEMPGQQVLPGQPAAPMGAMPPQPGQPAGQMPPTG